MRPTVSVVMIARNARDYVARAVQSLLRQSYPDFELIIVNDGSEDDTGRIVRRIADRRIVLVEREHRGIVASRNDGLDIARGRYLAVLDSDDVALPDRLERQVQFLDRHPEIGILGTAYALVDTQERCVGLVQWPVTDVEIRWVSLLASPFGHSTVMMRREMLVNCDLRYTSGFDATEDYELWTRVLAITRARTLPQPLVLYRVHPSSVTAAGGGALVRKYELVALRTICESLPGVGIDPQQVSQLRRLFGGRAVQAGEHAAVAAANTYLDMLGAFLHRHRHAPGLGALRRQVALRVAARAFPFRHQPGWAELLFRLARLDPLFPTAALPHAVRRFTGQMAIRRR